MIFGWHKEISLTGESNFLFENEAWARRIAGVDAFMLDNEQPFDLKLSPFKHN